MRSLHHLLLIAVLTLAGSALVACGEDKASEKKAAVLQGEGFTVAMPGSAERSVITTPSAAGPVEITAYVTEGGSEGFSMSVFDIPKGVQGDLDGAVNGAATSVKGKVADSTKTTYQGFQARDARIAGAQDSNGNKGTVFARVILAKGRLFQLQFVTGGADVKTPPASYTTFVSSLKIG